MDETGPGPKRKDIYAMQIRTTVQVHELFSQAAEQEGLTLSAWARSRLPQAARREVKPERAKRDVSAPEDTPGD